MRNLALLLDDPEDAVRYKAQLVVEMISLSPTAAAALNCADYLFLILRLLGGSPKTQDEKTIVFHLATLKMLLESDVKEEALRHNAMNILLEKADSENEKIKALALDCIALLCHCPAGRAEAADKDVGVILCKKLFDPSMEVKAKVAGALAFATIQSDMRKKLCKKCTVEVLVKILENFHNSEGQMMAMKVLSNLSEEPEGKSLVKSMKVQIRQVFTGNDKEVERHKKMLIYLLKKK